jgi:hypothetical protein
MKKIIRWLFFKFVLPGIKSEVVSAIMEIRKVLEPYRKQGLIEDQAWTLVVVLLEKINLSIGEK